jgi:phosphoribosyl-AMP cyclohydrolase
MDDVELAFNEEGLLPVIAQEESTGTVLMLAYANDEAISRTNREGIAYYFSRSRQELWQKGQTSGHTQHVNEIRVDCDGDAVLYLVEQDGGACHTGYHSCFYRTIDGEQRSQRTFDPDTVYDDE